MIVASGMTSSDAREYRGIQKLINSGRGWSMEGAVGWAISAALHGGYVLLAREIGRDYYGNLILTRQDQIPGKPGSYSYVKKCHGERWANSMRRIK
jgi:hypothetical protein